MRTLLIASACIAVFVGPALACRGAAEYPQISMQLEQLKGSPDRTNTLMEKVRQGQSMHQEGHRLGDMGKLLTSLRILDELKEEVAPWVYSFSPPRRILTVPRGQGATADAAVREGNDAAAETTFIVEPWRGPLSRSAPLHHGVGVRRWWSGNG